MDYPLNTFWGGGSPQSLNELEEKIYSRIEKNAINTRNIHRLKWMLKKNMNKHPEAVQTALNFQNKKGQTILHRVADRSDAEVVRILLDLQADPLIRDAKGRIPLHMVVDLQVDEEQRGCRCENCCDKDVECVKYLVEEMIIRGSTLDVADQDHKTPLYYTAQNMMPQCATVLLQNHADIMPLKGKTITSTGEKTRTIGELLVQKIPEVMVAKLDEGVKFHKTNSSKLALDFTIILQREDLESGASPRKETDLLSIVLKAHKVGREVLLNHPLVEAFLYLKWKSVSKWFWVIRILYYLLAMLYTVFIFNVFLINCKYPIPYEPPQNDIRTENPLEITEFDDDDIICEKTPIMTVMASLMLVGVFSMMSNELYEIWHVKKKYFRDGLNYAWWILIACVVATILPAFGLEPQKWQYPIAAFGVFYAWGMTLVQVGRIPRVGVYVEMLGKVLNDFGIFALTYLSLLLGFSLGFCVLFPEDEMFEYKAFPKAFVKILLIMIGETDYEGLLQDEATNSRADEWQYTILAHIMFVGFIIVATIVLMNLLLGLAVSDIQELQKTAELLKVTRQIQQIALFESLIYSKIIPGGLSMWAIKYFSIEYSIEHLSVNDDRDEKEDSEGILLHFSPVDPEDRKLPEYLKAKFVKYLTSSVCLNLKNIKNKLQNSNESFLIGAVGDIVSRAVPLTTDDSMAVSDEEETALNEMQMLKMLQESILELHKQMREINIRLNRIDTN